MEKILIADDNRILLLFLQKRLQRFNESLEIIPVKNGEEAIEVLKNKYISLLVTDIVMPKVDGLKLLSYINNKHPHIPCIVITGQPIDSVRQRVTEDNIYRFFQKPFQFEEFMQAIVEALEQDIPHGTLKGISVASFLQMIELEEKTCLFEVSSESRGKGTFYFINGIPYDAVYRDLEGEEAAMRLIGMNKAEIRFKPFPARKVEQRINKQLTYLIMEAMRKKDEADG